MGIICQVANTRQSDPYHDWKGYSSLVLHVSLSPREWTQNDIATLEGFALCVNDIVKDRTLALEERKSRVDLQQIVATRSDYIAHVAHEIRTPLTGIIGSIKMLSQMKSEDQSARLMSILNRSADKLLGFVNDGFDSPDGSRRVVSCSRSGCHNALRLPYVI